MAEKRARIAGLGIALPDRRLTNQDLEKMVDTDDEWIRTRTGIRERRIAEPGQMASDFGLQAAREALKQAHVNPEEIDLIIVATSTPDMPFPATACLVQQKLGAVRAAAFDMEAACSGFLYGLSVGSQFIQAGAYENVLVIGVDLLSRMVDFTDRSTCILFSDGCGAALLRPATADEGFLSFYLGADGSGAELLYVTSEGARKFMGAEERQGEHIRMKGREVFRLAVKVMGEAAETVLRRAGISADQVDLLVPHQANLRIIEASARRFGLPMEKVVINVDRYGNMSSASVPVALYEAVAEGRVAPGDIVLLIAFGGGLTWGASVLRW